jgi:hypothetical protein
MRIKSKSGFIRNRNNGPADDRLVGWSASWTISIGMCHRLSVVVRLPYRNPVAVERRRLRPAEVKQWHFLALYGSYWKGLQCHFIVLGLDMARAQTVRPLRCDPTTSGFSSFTPYNGESEIGQQLGCAVSLHSLYTINGVLRNSLMHSRRRARGV